MHPEAGLILLPNHCSYSWKSSQNGKKVDSDGHSIFADDRYTNLDLGEKNGETKIEVTASSRHFKDKKKFHAEVAVQVVKEEELDKQVFDKAHVGDDKTFSRDAKGNLQANPDQKPLTVEDEIRSVDLARGGFRELAKEGKITQGDRDTLEEQATNQRAALVEIQEKVKGGTPYLVRGTFISREDSSSFELKLMMHVVQQKTANGIAFYNVILHDLTTGDATQHPGSSWHPLEGERPDTVFKMIEGEALEAMAEHFHAHNDYPKGTVHLAAQRLAGAGVWEKTLNTNNWRKKTKKVLGTVAMVGGVALLVVPGGGEVAMGIMIVTGAAGAGSVALEIEDRIAKEGKLKFDRRLLMDVLQLASTVLQFGALSTALREASVVGKSRYMLAMVGVDAAQGFVIAADTSDALKKIDAETAVKLAHATTDEEKKEILAERDQRVAEVIGGAVVSGGFLLVSIGGGIKQVVATTRAGKQFTVREPIKALGEGSITDIEAAIAKQSFTHENGSVVMTEAETQYLEATLMQRKAAAAGGGEAGETAKAPSDSPTQKMPAQDPEAGKPAHERTTQKIPAQDPEAGKAPHERTTQKMPAQDPSKLPAHEPTRVTFQGNGDTIATAAAKVAPEPGYFDVAVHGDPNNFYVLHNGSWVPVKPNSLRKWLLKQPGYHGQNIRLISCEAGAAGDGVAQAMANGLGVDVKAPTETLWVLDDGSIVIGADPHQPSTGKWQDFSPRKQPATAPEGAPKPSDPNAPAPEPHANDPVPEHDEPAPDLDPGGGTEFGKPKKDPNELPPRKSNGEFVDAELEQKYQEYRARKKKAKEHPRGRIDWKERSDWWKEHSPVARGNKFNASVRARRLYPYNEVNLVDGLRLDSYVHDGHAERISRKATDFLAISDAEFTAYVKEIDLKYPKGKKIRSNTMPDIDGQRLRGDPVLEVPAENLAPTEKSVTGDPDKMKDLAARRERFEKIAADNGVELRYTAE